MQFNKPTTNHRILVIDDNAAIHEDFRKILTKTKSFSGNLIDMEAAIFGSVSQISKDTYFELNYAFQGRDGLNLVKQALAEARPYALAFVDGRMPPGWDGIETISYLWKEYPDLQVVLCTAYTDYSWDDIQRVLGESDNFLILKKPFDNVEVLQLAHALTRKWELNRLKNELISTLKLSESELCKHKDHLEEMVDQRTRDLTEVNQRLQNEILQRIKIEEELRNAKEAIESSDRAKTTFIAHMGHELRTPLNSILGAVQSIKKTTDFSSKLLSLLSIIHQNSEKLLVMTDDLMDLIKIESGKLKLESHVFSFPDMVNHIGEIYKREAEIKQLLFRYEFSEWMPKEVTGDAKRLATVLHKLLNNALKFTSNGSVIFRVLNSKSNTLAKICFEIEDTGKGIHPLHIEEIFKPFHHEDNQKIYAEGIGIGLSISQCIIRLMGGELHVSSKPGKGTRFWFEIVIPFIGEIQINHTCNILQENRTVILPPEPEVIERLYKAAIAGDLEDIETIAEEIKNTDTGKALFAEKLQQMSYNFMIEQLQDFIQQYRISDNF
ncbi:MAG: hypothetical protein HQK77_07870 [Desulfobacterales bacterium]|nr:hypothetical protein [Desulfobacterales bacterium]